jgi:predicted metal-dependent hydrolase
MFSDIGGIVEYGDTKIQFVVRFSDRKTLAIEVHPNGEVIVISPKAATEMEIQLKVEKRSGWIAKQLRHFRAYPFNENKMEWISGETVYYLGRQYRLKIIKGEDAVKLQGKFLNVWQREKSDTQKSRFLIEDWYQNHANKIFLERVARMQPILSREKLTINKVFIKPLDKRWGSCTKKGSILLNTMLVKTPIYCIDYVITHEICHLKYHDHSPKFWSMLRKYSPDWFKVKEKLEHGGWQ